MLINRGDVYWVQAHKLMGASEEVIPHPYVVVQDDLFNHSRISTVVACPLTSNLKRVSVPGNVLLEVGEANLPKASVVEVAKILSLEKADLGDYIGSLAEQRIRQILLGIGFIQRAFFVMHRD